MFDRKWKIPGQNPPKRKIFTSIGDEEAVLGSFGSDLAE